MKDEGVEVYCFLVSQCTPTSFPKGLTTEEVRSAKKIRTMMGEMRSPLFTAVHRLVGLLVCTNTK